jgi:hypothetical protein
LFPSFQTLRCTQYPKAFYSPTKHQKVLKTLLGFLHNPLEYAVTEGVSFPIHQTPKGLKDAFGFSP